LAIDLSTQKLQEFCAVLNEFALPRAIVDFERHSFVAWNSKFLEQTGFSEDEMKSSKPEELLIFGESWFPLSEEREGQTVEYIACAARRAFGADPAPGFTVRSHGKIGYLMLDVFDSSSAQFEQGRNAGREEERNRVIRTFHEEVSSSMIAALFLIETAKSELEDAGLPQAEAVSKASDILAETTEKIAHVIGEADRNSE
jgi:PAS domain-containing protein